MLFLAIMTMSFMNYDDGRRAIDSLAMGPFPSQAACEAFLWSESNDVFNDYARNIWIPKGFNKDGMTSECVPAE